jgi:ribosomal protein S18 acetylase RimI-like enzyme
MKTKSPESSLLRYEWVAAGDRHAVTEAVRLVVAVSADEPFVGLPAQPAPEDIRLLTEKLFDGLATGRSQLLTVRHGDEGVIACAALVRPATANQRHIGELTTGAVHPDYRGRGVVTAALREITRYCERNEIELLRLDVRAGVAAERIWRYFGFEEYGRLADYGRVDGESYTGVYLCQSVARLGERTAKKEV